MLRRLVASALLALASLGCGDSSSPATGPAASGNEVVIGHYASMTGSEANFGIFTDNGIKLAIQERNAAGGVGGKQVRLITYDDQSKATEAATAVTKLVTGDRVAAVIGEVASSRSIAGGQVCQRFGVPMVSPSSTNPDVTAIGDKIFRVCFIDPFQGGVAAKFAQQKGWTKAAILYDRGQAYSTGLQKNFKEAFAGEVVTEQAYAGGDSDFGAQLANVKASGAEFIFLPGYYQDVGNVALQLKKAGMALPMLGTDGWTGVVGIGPEVAAALEGSFYSDHYSAESTEPRVVNFLTKYKEKFEGVTPDSMAALGYDAANILFAAMDRAGGTDSAKVAAELAKTSAFEGVTGVISIDAERNARKPAVMLEVSGGKTKYVTTVEP